MRFLANENFPLAAVAALRQVGVDTSWIRSDAPGLADSDVLALARMENRVLLAFDKDFDELVFKRGENASCGVVLFRIALTSPQQVAKDVVAVLQARDDWAGQFSVADGTRLRMRKLPRSTGP